MTGGLKLYRKPGLGPEKAPTKEILKYDRRMNFAEAVRAQHKQKIRTRSENPVPSHVIELEKKQEKRRKQLQYAATLPLPQKPAKPHQTEGHPTLKNQRENSDQSLNHLLLRHNNEKARVNRLKALANIK